jgi:hypothetical protein
MRIHARCCFLDQGIWGSIDHDRRNSTKAMNTSGRHGDLSEKDTPEKVLTTSVRDYRIFSRSKNAFS